MPNPSVSDIKWQGWLGQMFGDADFRGLSGIEKIGILKDAGLPGFGDLGTRDQAQFVAAHMTGQPEMRLPSTGSAIQDVAQGAAGELARPVVTGVDLARKAMGMPPLAERPEVQYALNPPQGAWGRAGGVAGEILPYAIPIGGEALGAGKIALEAARGGLVGGLQTGTPTGALWGAAGGAGGEAVGLWARGRIAPSAAAIAEQTKQFNILSKAGPEARKAMTIDDALAAVDRRIQDMRTAGDSNGAKALNKLRRAWAGSLSTGTTPGFTTVGKAQRLLDSFRSLSSNAERDLAGESLKAAIDKAAPAVGTMRQTLERSQAMRDALSRIPPKTLRKFLTDAALEGGLQIASRSLGGAESPLALLGHGLVTAKFAMDLATRFPGFGQALYQILARSGEIAPAGGAAGREAIREYPREAPGGNQLDNPRNVYIGESHGIPVYRAPAAAKEAKPSSLGPRTATAPRSANLAPSLADAIVRFEGNQSGSVARRNNNPGNLKFANQPGAVGQDANGFAIFRDYDAGYQALLRQIKRTMGRTGNLQQFFADYAPATDNNKPLEYARTVGGWLGIDPRSRFSELQ